MANEQNLRPCEYKLSQEEAKKGGQRSGASRRRKAELKKSVQDLLNFEYQVKAKDGTVSKQSGADVVAKAIMKNASDPNCRNWKSAIDTILRLSAKDTEKLEEKKLKIEIALLQAKLQAMTSNDTTVLDTLDKILEGVRATALKESDSAESGIIEKTE